MNLNVKIKFIPVILLFLSILLLSSTTMASNNTDTWNQFHKDVAHTGFSPGEAPDTGKLLWVSDPIWAIPSSSPVIAEGKVFVKCGVDQVNSMSTTPEELRIVTIDEYTGNIISSDEIGPVTPCWSSLCYDNGKIWYGRADALNGGPMVADGKVFDSDGESHHYYCTDAETEEELWNFTVTGVAIGTPAYYEGKVYLTSGPLFSSPGHVYCVNAENGDELWNQTLPYEAGGSPAVSEGVVYATTYDGNLYALDAEDGSILWSETVPSTDVSSTPAIAYGNVYISGGCPGISTIETYCFNATTHEMVWNTSAEDKIGGWTASVAVADGMIFVGKYAEDDYFGYAGTYALDAYTGDVVWSYPSGGASPAISDGILFTIGADGRVYAFTDPEELYFEPQEAVFSDIGSVESLNLYLDQAPAGLAGYKLNLSISDPSVARITGVEFPSWSGVNNSSSLPADSVQIGAVDLTEKINAGDSDVFLGTVTVESLASGEANLTVSVDRLDDDSENTISVTVREAKLTVENSDNPIVSILPAESTLSSGESQVFEIRADKFPDGLSGYDFNLTLENPAVGNFTDVEYPSWVGLSENSSMPNTSIKVKAVDTTDVVKAGDENVLLASATFVAETPGESEISLTFNRLDDDPGSNINAVTEASSVKVQGSSTLPVANFTATPTSGDSPLTVQFTDESAGSPTAWAWDFDSDGNVDSTEQNPGHTYSDAGSYTVNLTVTNEDGSDSELKTDYITVSESSTPVEPVAAFTADVTNGTVPLTVNFTDKSTESPTSWAWDFDNDGSIDSTEQNPSYTYTSAGTYTVNLTVANAEGNDSEVKTDYITASESSTPTEPVAAFNADVTNGTVPLTVNFTDQSTGTPTSWAWDFDNDGSIDSTEQNPSYTYTAEGNYTVNLTVSSAAGGDSEVKAEYITVTDSSTTPEDRPDLIVSSIIPPSGITANTSCNIGATISNTGESDAGAFNATLSVNGEVVDTSTVSGIGSGSSANVNFSWKPVAAGYYSVKVSADAEDAIDESDETNNELEDCIKVEEASSGSQNGSSSVSLNVTIVPVISLEVSPSALDFGELYPGKTSELQYLTLKNRGSCDVNVTAVVCDSSDGDSLFSQGLLLDSQLWNNYWKVVGGDSQENTSVVLKVPADYAGSGNKKGTITFWAEAAE
ncbi:cell surface protein [Methanosarcina siciliae T4/M]|uniref:Cell surface protein n=1 Tax=Methanosarcina siciliae T4/M TaxID=1434120 RepID=A0A0E3P235_9EURY|nr:PKD domain-containing protein [Methanosarcina siciliae]AKB27475.1 cell surface protein [Methanosarcina siciliae T4/M]